MTTDRYATSPGAQALGHMSTTIDGLDFIASRRFDLTQPYRRLVGDIPAGRLRPPNKRAIT